MEQEKQYILPESIRTALLSYLAGKPYVEVHQGIAALSQLQESKTGDAS